jgi:hypothetical protein
MANQDKEDEAQIIPDSLNKGEVLAAMLLLDIKIVRLEAELEEVNQQIKEKEE